MVGKIVPFSVLILQNQKHFLGSIVWYYRPFPGTNCLKNQVILQICICMLLSISDIFVYPKETSIQFRHKVFSIETDRVNPVTIRAASCCIFS